MELKHEVLKAINKEEIYMGFSQESSYEIPFNFKGLEYYIDIDVVINVYPSSTHVEFDKFEVLDNDGELVNSDNITEQDLIDSII